MPKNPTNWSGNPSAETSEYVYDSASLDYDSASRNYDGVVDNDLADSEKTPIQWSDA